MKIPEIVSTEHINLSIVTAHLPEGANGIVMQDGTGCHKYTILINADLPESEQREAFLHECLHIWNHDLEKAGTESINQIEYRTHQQIEQFTS